jgi:nitroimidazol reductase NimA-like FMN-containing flavoprotein (pyridoxamine 5'-phosphate oxidase superfamily)
MSSASKTPKPDTTHRRLAEYGGRDFDQAAAIIDAARICQLGFVLEGQPYVVPMACARSGRQLLMHGSVASRLAKRIAGQPVCATITHLDGIVLARSAFHSSMNYRSVMIFGNLTDINDAGQKAAGLDRITEQLAPGRLAEVRPSTRKELNATCLLSLPIEVFTTKVSNGPPEDPASDLEAPIWAGVIPLETRAGTPIDAPDLKIDIAAPAYIKDY